MILKNNCPICNTPTIVENYSEKDVIKANCSRCGKYEISEIALTYFQRNDIPHKTLSVSYWIRQNQIDGRYVQIDLESLRHVINILNIPKPLEQANRLLLWMGDNISKPNEETDISLNDLISIVGAYDEDGIKYIADYIKDSGFIKHRGFAYTIIDGERNPPIDLLRATMTFNGWEKYYELKVSNKDSRLAFMAMKFNEEPILSIYNSLIKNVVKSTGFDIRKLDEEKRAGLIDDKLRVEIRRSKFLISDLTDHNNGAYWEAGYAEGLGIPVIYICEENVFKDKSKSTHFDTNHHLTVTWKNDAEELKEFADELKATIRATFPNEAKMEDK